jgi:hypothetical protein
VAAVGCDREAACLIGEEDAIDFIDGHEDKVSAVIVGFLMDILHSRGCIDKKKLSKIKI